MTETQKRFFKDLAKTIAFNAEQGKLDAVRALLRQGIYFAEQVDILPKEQIAEGVEN